MTQEYFLCKHCGKPLLDNDLVNNAYKSNNTWAWALKRLNVIVAMLVDEEKRKKNHTLERITTNQRTINSLKQIIEKVVTLADLEEQLCKKH